MNGTISMIIITDRLFTNCTIYQFGVTVHHTSWTMMLLTRLTWHPEPRSACSPSPLVTQSPVMEGKLLVTDIIRWWWMCSSETGYLLSCFIFGCKDILTQISIDRYFHVTAFLIFYHKVPWQKDRQTTRCHINLNTDILSLQHNVIATINVCDDVYYLKQRLH